MNTNYYTENQFFHALKELQITKLLRKSNITKSCGVSVYEVFQFLLLMVFQGKNLFRFLMLLAVKVTSAFDILTRSEMVNVLIVNRWSVYDLSIMDDNSSFVN